MRDRIGSVLTSIYMYDWTYPGGNKCRWVVTTVSHSLSCILYFVEPELFCINFPWSISQQVAHESELYREDASKTGDSQTVRSSGRAKGAFTTLHGWNVKPDPKIGVIKWSSLLNFCYPQIGEGDVEVGIKETEEYKKAVQICETLISWYKASATRTLDGFSQVGFIDLTDDQLPIREWWVWKFCNLNVFPLPLLLYS